MALIRCAECGAQISDKAAGCPRCGAPVDPDAKRKGFGCWTFLLLMFGGLVFVVGLIVYLLPSSRSTKEGEIAGQAAATTPTATPQAWNGEPIQASWKFSNQDGIISLKGEAKNVSAEPLKHVVVVGVFPMSDGSVKEEEALLIPDPMEPGQTSPFDIHFKGDPQMRKYEVIFRDTLKRPIAHFPK